MDGILVVDKPGGISSAAAVDRVKRTLGVQRAGHGGTLDPMATGVLVICLGEATKVASYLLADAKAYVAELVLGTETDTLDRTGTVVATRDSGHVSRAMVEAALAQRLGEQDQVPPMYSAIKHHGVRLYHHARSGVEVERAPRRIRIDQLDLLAFAPGRVTIAIACSKGTYVRSLVSDLGRDLGCGAHLAELRRTRSGVFSIEQAVGFEVLDRRIDPPPHSLDGSAAHPGGAGAREPPPLLPIEAALALQIVSVPVELVVRVRSGVQLAPAQLPGLEALQLGADRFQLRDPMERLIAIAHVERGRVVYDRVFRAE